MVTIKKKSHKKPTNHRESGSFTFCIGVFWLCTGNDWLDVLPIGRVHPGLCGLLCGGARLNTLDDNGGTVLARSKTQCHGNSSIGQLDGQFCGWHWFPQYEGKYDDLE